MQWLGWMVGCFESSRWMENWYGISPVTGSWAIGARKEILHILDTATRGLQYLKHELRILVLTVPGMSSEPEIHWQIYKVNEGKIAPRAKFTNICNIWLFTVHSILTPTLAWLWLLKLGEKLKTEDVPFCGGASSWGLLERSTGNAGDWMSIWYLQ
jgi:hypothetical protein